jgi:hypothetical protein
MVAASRLQTTDPSDRAVDARRALHAAIKTRWSKFTDFELGALSDNGDLVNQVAIKYGLELSRARTEVEGLLKGRKV